MRNTPPTATPMMGREDRRTDTQSPLLLTLSVATGSEESVVVVGLTSTSTCGSPVLLSSMLMLSAVSPAPIASAAASSLAFTLTSMRSLDSKRRLRAAMRTSTLSIDTSAGGAPAALAIDSVNLACFASSKSALDRERDNESFTKYVVAGDDEGSSSARAAVSVLVSPCPPSGGEGAEEGDMDGSQGPPFGPVKPMMQTQACLVELTEPAEVCELSGQAVHPVLPGSVLYLPCSQARHTPLSGE